MFWKKKKKQSEVVEVVKEFVISDNQKTGKLPDFDYHKNVIETGVIRKETIKCDCCNQESEYVYDGPMYGAADFEQICPWCISEGRAHNEFGVFFNSDFEGEEIPQDIKKKLFSIIPSYTSWQDPIWFTHCNDACIFLGYVGYKEIKSLGIEDDLSSEFERHSSEMSMTLDEFKQHLVNDGHIQGYLFKCKHCDTYKLHVDFT